MPRPVLVRVKPGQRNANEVDQVVAGKGHGQCKGATEHHEAQHIDT